ncbi:uncharacterized protein [Leptinotarsa decemlineata]|uniref:uncharacterized protein n=1 Tax=Leptinotarsa decemlineata TaxID=7539 RepID=UPI003D303FD8
MNLSKENDNHQDFLRLAQQQFANHTYFFTDGSKDERGNVGIGVFSHNLNHSGRLPSFFSICSAEITAIQEAIQYIVNNDLKHAVIFSDLKSALAKISRSTISANSDYLSLRTRQLIYRAVAKGFSIHLAWIPSHSNIKGNDIAHTLANIGRNHPLSNYPQADYREFQALLKHNIWIDWTNQYSEDGQFKAKLYFSSVPQPYKTPWFKDLATCSRKEIVNMCRIRSTHSLNKAHLHKIKIVDDDRCECGEI